MHYDPVKQTLAKLLRGRFLRRAFHLGLDLLFLRAWYVRKEMKRIRATPPTPPSIEGGDNASRASIEGGDNASRASIEGGDYRILDAGMGFGQYSDRMARLFPHARITGLEIDRAHMYGGEDYFRAVHPGFQFTLGDVQILPFKAGSFDLIVTVDVMEHIPDDRAAFNEYARVLKPGGRLLMHTPRDTTPPTPPSVEGGGKASSPSIEGGGKASPPSIEGGDNARWTVGEHVRDGYRDEDAREKIEGAGLKVERMVRGYGNPGMVAWTLLQRVPMTMLGASRLLIPVVVLWLLVVIVPAVIAMYLDRSAGDRPEGGSLMVIARKPA